MPGAAGLRNITNLAKSEITTLTNSDAVIVCGGSNDVNRDRSQAGLHSLTNFVNLRTNAKVLILTLPPRHDLIQDSCVNREIHSFNRKLHKIMKNKERVKILDCDITREVSRPATVVSPSDPFFLQLWFKKQSMFVCGPCHSSPEVNHMRPLHTRL